MYQQQEPDQGHTSKGYTYINYCPEGCDLVTVTVIIAYSMTATLACCKPDNPPLQGIGLWSWPLWCGFAEKICLIRLGVPPTWSPLMTQLMQLYIAYYMGSRKGLQEASLLPCACPITCRTYPSKVRYIFKGKKPSMYLLYWLLSWTTTFKLSWIPYFNFLYCCKSPRQLCKTVLDS